MKYADLFRDVPATGDAVLVTPKCTDDQLAHVLVLAILSLSEVLRHQPTTFMFRFAGRKSGVVFSEPAPRPIIDLLADLFGVDERSVRLEALGELTPVLRLSRQGIRVYPGPDRPGGFTH